MRLTDYNNAIISHLSMRAARPLILNITLTRAISDWYSVKVITLTKYVFLLKINNITQDGVWICPHHVTCIFPDAGSSPLFKVRI